MTAAPDPLAPPTRSDLDALRVPAEAPLPADTITRAMIAVELDQWWHRLTLGQRLALHLEHGA